MCMKFSLLTLEVDFSRTYRNLYCIGDHLLAVQFSVVVFRMVKTIWHHIFHTSILCSFFVLCILDTFLWPKSFLQLVVSSR